MLEQTIGDRCIRVIQGDITERDVDAIVNAANVHLQHGGGVAYAIVKKGGRVIQDESDRIAYCPVGGAVLTTGGKLKAGYVIHTVGPKMGEGDEDNKLKSAIISVLRLASERGFKSISVPAISAGIYGFPKERCAKILIEETRNYLRLNPQSPLQCVEFCLFDDDTFKHFKRALEFEPPKS